ncbi:MAG: MoxR family ATPase [Spirochaetales bacterium]|nr:MoxR family ATPase [Spirochaetales bacterium]
MKRVRAWAETIANSTRRAFFGKEEAIEKLLIALLCRGHVLIEDVPGVGKTIAARALGQSLGGTFKRIQCTPDLLPADVLGVSVYNPKSGEFSFREGPILSNVLLVDEINRATPRTQSALLEAMAENQISVDGRRILLPEPFFLMATENPVEFEGTFPLPEAQKDRFFLSLEFGYPDRVSEEEILESQRRTSHPVTDIEAVTDLETVLAMQQLVVEVHVAPALRGYILDITGQTRKEPRLRLGVSPRGSLALYKGAQALAAIRGRDYVVPEDVKELFIPVCAKRVIVRSEHLIKGITAEELLRQAMEKVEVPVLKGVR